MKARTRKKRAARWLRRKRIMSKRCLDAHDRRTRPTCWSWLIGFYR